MDPLFNTILVLPLLSSIWPARTNWVQSPFRPARFNGLQYHSGQRPLARMVQQIVNPGIRYGTGKVH